MPVPPRSVRKQAKIGLEWRKEYGRGGTEVGVARARDLSNGVDLSEDTIRRMKSYFARHAVDAKAEGFHKGEKGFPSAGRIAWELWGGDAGKKWVDGQLNQESVYVRPSMLSEAPVKAVTQESAITRPQLDQLEAELRASLREFGLEVVFTDHFFDRMNASRNSPPLRLEEIRSLFMLLTTRKKMRGRLKSEREGYEAVLFDLKSLINIPFKLSFDSRRQVHKIIPLTVMRSKSFKSSSPVIRLEGVEIFLRHVLTDGSFALFEKRAPLSES